MLAANILMILSVVFFKRMVITCELTAKMVAALLSLCSILSTIRMTNLLPEMTNKSTANL